MKSFCAVGHKKELNCCGNGDSTSCCDYPFIAGSDILKCPEPKSIFAGPSLTVDIEFKEVNCTVGKGQGVIFAFDKINVR